MEIIVLIAILVAGVAVYYNTRTKPTKTSEEAPYKLEPKTTKVDGIGHESTTVQPVVSNVLDVNKDGKVNVQDAIAVIDKTIEAAKVVKEKTKAAAKKATAKKAPAKTKKSK
jgi:hypothetical protein